MRPVLSIPVGFLIGLLLAALVWPARVVSGKPAPTETPSPTLTVTPTAQPTQTGLPPTPSAVPSPTIIPTLEVGGIRIVEPVDVAKGITLGLTGAVECWNCAPFAPSFDGQPVKVKLSNYTPWADDKYSCWQWDDELKYCMSETRSGNDWEPYYGFSAACPPGWKFGTWVVIEEVGSFICLDQGTSVICHEGNEEEMARHEPPHCHVDILGPSGPWNQHLYDATLWVSLNPRR